MLFKLISRFLFSTLVALLLSGCKKTSFEQVQLIGHAGNGLENPASIYHSNSQEAIEMALQTQGVDAVEIDVQISKDGTFWLLHDDHLEDETTGNGYINDKHDSELSTIHYQSLHKEKLVRLELFPFEKFSGKTFYLDIRHYHPHDESILPQQLFIDKIHNLIDNHPSVNFIVITNYLPWIPLFLDAQIEIHVDCHILERAQEVTQLFPSIAGIVIRTSQIDVNQIKSFQNQNFKVTLFDIRSIKTTRESIRKQPNSILVDDIKTAVMEKY